MKKFKFTICISLMMIGAFALLPQCQSLDENAAGTLVAGQFYQTEEDLDAAVTGIYSQLCYNRWGGLGHTNHWIPMMGADDLTTQAGKTNEIQADVFNLTATNDGLKAGSWTPQYRVIYAANSVLENADNVDAKEDVILEAKAEACFLRAWSYFWLVRVFGEVPINLDNEVDYTLPKSEVSEVYDQIVKDLTYSIENLQEDKTTSVGRPGKLAAKALLAQVYLQMTGWPLFDNNKYELAASNAKDVITSEHYNLLQNYSDLWTATSDGNNEVIWAIIFCNYNVCGNANMNTFTGLNTQPGEENGWDQIFCEVGFFNRFPEGPRKDATFLTTFTNPTTFETTKWQNSTYAHPFLKKYRDGMVASEPNYSGSTHMGGRDLNYLRLAEVYLIYAEAQTMADGSPNDLAYDCINATRNRAGLDDLQTGLGQQAFCDSVLVEKGWELCGEYSRWFDLVRTEKVAEMNTLKDETDNQPVNSITEDSYFAPIPNSEVLLNPLLGE